MIKIQFRKKDIAIGTALDVDIRRPMPYHPALISPRTIYVSIYTYIRNQRLIENRNSFLK